MSGRARVRPFLRALSAVLTALVLLVTGVTAASAGGRHGWDDDDYGYGRYDGYTGRGHGHGDWRHHGKHRRYYGGDRYYAYRQPRPVVVLPFPPFPPPPPFFFPRWVGGGFHGHDEDCD